MKKTTQLTFAALLIAIDIIFTRFFSFMLPGNFDRISLQFVPHAIAGYLYNPLYAMLITVAGDILGMLLNSGGFSFNPGFTISAILKGFLYSLLLNKSKLSYKHLLLTSIILNFTIDILLNPLWLSILYGNGYFEIMLIKIPIRFVWVFISSGILYAVFKSLKPVLSKYKS